MSSKNKRDPRVRRTRSWLTQALFMLMKEHAYEEISVAMITQKAGVSRQTFYLHYKTKREILSAYITDIFDNFEKQVRFEKSLPEQDHAVAVQMFELLASHSERFRLIRHEQFSSLVQKHLQEKCRMMLKLFCIQFGAPQCSQAMFNHTSDYVAGAAGMLISSWIDGGFQETPERMGLTFHELTLPVLQKAFYSDWGRSTEAP